MTIIHEEKSIPMSPSVSVLGNGSNMLIIQYPEFKFRSFTEVSYMKIGNIYDK